MYYVLSIFPESHVSHLQSVSEDEINRLLGMVVDVENLFTCVHKEEDVDTKQVYFYLFKVRECSLLAIVTALLLLF
jgi:histone acetyltransferase